MSSSSSSSKPFVQAGEPLNDFLRTFWQRQIDTAEQETPDYRHPPLPLARIKKVMKSDPDIKMIAADAPILFCKACEIFISEITARAFIIADSNKRRTLSRSDIAKALSKSDQFDFLIDIVPRDDPPMPFPSGTRKGIREANIKKEKEREQSSQSVPLDLDMGTGEQGTNGSISLGEDSATGTEVFDQFNGLLDPSGSRPPDLGTMS